MYGYYSYLLNVHFKNVNIFLKLRLDKNVPFIFIEGNETPN